MAHKQPRGRHLMIQREFGKLGVGRMYQSSGTTSRETFRRINEMLSALGKDGSQESVLLLTQLRRREKRFLDVLQVYKRKGLEGLFRLAHDAPLDADSFASWLAGHTATATTRASYEANYRTLMRFAKRSGTMKDLPVVLRRYREHCNANLRNFRAFDLTLAVCRAWVKTALGEKSEVYESLRDVKPFRKPKNHRQNLYLSPRDVQDIMQKLPDSIAAMVWTMATHGLGPKEYLLDGIQAEGDGLHIFGKKHAHRDRIVPLIAPPAPVAVRRYPNLYNWIVAASGGRIKPYDLRRCYARWLHNARVPSNRVTMYQGHSEQSQTDDYAFYEAQKFLRPDAEALREWIASELEANAPSVDHEKVTVRQWLRDQKSDAYRPEYGVKEA